MNKTLILGVCLGVISTAVYAQEGDGSGADGADQPASIGQGLAYQTDTFTGRFSYSIPLKIAPARQGAEPTFALSYSSGGGGNSWVGYGWSLDVGFIQRNPQNGVPVKFDEATGEALAQYDDGKGFFASFGGINSKLVRVQNNEYRAAVDPGVFVKFEYLGDSWLVTDKSGNKFYFGRVNNSRMIHPDFTPDKGRHIFRWALDKVVDINGNLSEYTYYQDEGQLFLKEAKYNGNTNGHAMTHKVRFTIEDRSDKTFSYLTGYRVALNKRLKQVEMSVSGDLVRRYSIDYETSPLTGRSRLKRVTEIGNDGQSTLPPQVFSYRDEDAGFAEPVLWMGASNYQSTITELNLAHVITNTTNGNSRTVESLLDMDGDGLVDRVTIPNAAPHNRYLINFNTGSGFTSQIEWTGVDGLGLGGDNHSNSLGFIETDRFSLILADINADGRPDRVMRRNVSPYDRFIVQLNHGKGFDAPTEWLGVSSQGDLSADWNAVQTLEGKDATKVAFLDINGDSLPDRVMRRTGPPFEYLVVQLNTGEAFGPELKWGTLDSLGQPTDADIGSINATQLEDSDNTTSTYIELMDLNGDGLPDRIMRKAAPYSHFIVQFNNGAGFEDSELWGPLESYDDEDNHLWGAVSYQRKDTTSYTEDVKDNYLGLRDVNADGLVDRIMIQPGQTIFEVQLNTGTGFGARQQWLQTDRLPQGFGIDSEQTGSSFSKGKSRFADMNGDGLMDRVWVDMGQSSNGYMVQLNTGGIPDLMTGISSEMGGEITIAYKISTEFDNRDRKWETNPWQERTIPLLPYPMPVVYQVTADNGMGLSGTTTYGYQGGFYDAEEKEFKGFHCVSITNPIGVKTRSYFHQGGGFDGTELGEFEDAGSRGKKGMTYRTEIWGNDGKRYRQSLNKVEEQEVHPNGWYFPYITQTVRMDYDPESGKYRAVAEGFDYNFKIGAVSRSANYGEVANYDLATHTFQDVAEDTTFTHTIYNKLPNGELLSRPAITKITSDAAGSQVLQATQYTYDDNGNVLDQKVLLKGP